MMNCLVPDKAGSASDLGLLLLRVSVGLMMAFSHGWGKIEAFFQAGEVKFADPIGIGPAASLFLAGSAEFFCSLALVIGLLTRLAAIPLAFTMLVAIFIIHADDPFSKQEFALLYLIPYLTLLVTGPGKFSVDSWIVRRFAK